MNINEIKTGFGDYLSGLNDISNKEYTDVYSDVSIFNYSDEFENYVTDELGYDTDEKIADIETLKQMDVKDGKLVFEDDGSDESFMAQFANMMLGNETVAKQADKDGNGELSQSEINSFLDSVGEIDDDKAREITKLSMSNFMNFLKNIANSQEKQIEASEKLSNINETSAEKEKATNSTANYGGLKSANIGSGSGSGSGAVSGSGSSSGAGSSSNAGRSSDSASSSGSSSNAEMTGSKAGLDKCDLDNKLIKYASQFNGYHEGNDTKFFEGSTCQGATTAGTPWCAAFVQYCVRNSGVETPDWYKQTSTSCSCSTYYNAAKNAGALTTDITQAKAGDLILFGSGGSQHIGIVAQDYSKAGALITIEGNHNDEVQVVDRTNSGNIAGIARMS